jgi:hypothetical protein
MRKIDARTTISQPFKILGKDELTVDEFVFVLSFDLGWFSPNDARAFLKNAEKDGLIIKDGEKMRANFEKKRSKRPLPEGQRKIIQRTIEETGMSEGEILKLVEEHKFGDILERDVLALLVAKELGVKVDDLVDEVYLSMIGGQDEL